MPLISISRNLMNTRIWRDNAIVKNGIANIINGAANWSPIFLIPYLMSNVYSNNEISIWAIAVQIVSYVNFLALGVQTAIGRYVAYYGKNSDEELSNLLITAFRYLRYAAIAGIACILVFILLVDDVYPDAPKGSLLVVLFIGITGCIQLLVSGYSAVFIGIQRNEYPAIINASYRAIQILLISLAINQKQPIDVLAMIYFSATLLGAAIQYIAYRNWTGFRRFSNGIFDKAILNNLWGFCYPIVVWQLGILLITGTDIFIIGWINFEYGAIYAIASSLAMVVAGVTGALATPLIQAGADLYRKERRKDLIRLLKAYTGGYLIFGAAMVSLVYITSTPLIEYIYGASYRDQVPGFLVVLTLAVTIRSIGAPYTAIVIGCGMQKKILLSPVVEGVSNVVFSVILGLMYGVYGVVWGSVIGACIGILFHFTHNMRATYPVTVYKGAYAG